MDPEKVPLPTALTAPVVARDADAALKIETLLVAEAVTTAEVVFRSTAPVPSRRAPTDVWTPVVDRERLNGAVEEYDAVAGRGKEPPVDCTADGEVNDTVSTPRLNVAVVAPVTVTSLEATHTTLVTDVNVAPRTVLPEYTSTPPAGPLM